MDALEENRWRMARLRGEIDAYNRIIERLTALTEPPPKRSTLDPFVALDRLINAGFDRFERFVSRVVSAIMR